MINKFITGVYNKTHGYAVGSLPVAVDNGITRQSNDKLVRGLIVSTHGRNDLVGASDRLVGYNESTVWR